MVTMVKHVTMLGKFALWQYDIDAIKVTCGSGEAIRTRVCNNGEPGQAGCEGEDQELSKCQASRRVCPKFALWASWSSCSVSCGVGKMTR